jgi:hypothetical protein
LWRAVQPPATTLTMMWASLEKIQFFEVPWNNFINSLLLKIDETHVAHGVACEEQTQIKISQSAILNN